MTAERAAPDLSTGSPAADDDPTTATVGEREKHAGNDDTTRSLNATMRGAVAPRIA